MVLGVDIRIVMEYKKPDGDGDEESRRKADHAHDRALAGKQYGQQAQHRGHAVEHGHGLLLIQAHSQEPVVKMALVSVKRTLAPKNAAEESENRVRQGDGQGQQRHKKAYDGMELE